MVGALKHVPVKYSPGAKVIELISFSLIRPVSFSVAVAVAEPCPFMTTFDPSQETGDAIILKSVAGTLRPFIGC